MNNAATAAPDGTGNVVRDNVWVPARTPVTDSGSWAQLHHNLNYAGQMPGTGNMIGTPVFASSPCVRLLPLPACLSSPGYHAASDGKSLGIAP